MTSSPLPPGVAKSIQSSKADYRRLGNSGLYVSVPIVGCMSIGNPEWASWVLGADEALPLLKAAYDRGINTVRSRPTELKTHTVQPHVYLLAKYEL